MCPSSGEGSWPLWLEAPEPVDLHLWSWAKGAVTWVSVSSSAEEVATLGAGGVGGCGLSACALWTPWAQPLEQAWSPARR